MVDRHDGVLTERGRHDEVRSMATANLAGETGTRHLFEPALLIAASAYAKTP